MSFLLTFKGSNWAVTTQKFMNANVQAGKYVTRGLHYSEKEDGILLPES